MVKAGWMDGFTDDQMISDGWVGGWMDGCLDGWMDVWI
jgi:hypothetical protein